jgi:thiamine-monophosphate kinase
MNEFELIARYFTRPAGQAVLGVGDDCALVAPAAGQVFAISTDMLIEGRHVLPGADPESLGHKTLAVNLSDCAAVGADPRYATLALALPEADEAWVDAFARGFFALADRFDVELIGGDTTRGPRAFSVTIFGEVPAGEALLRSGARAGDMVWVSGEVGAARVGLALECGEPIVMPPAGVAEAALNAMHRPLPRVALGLALRGIATAAIDISDGLLGDLAHILDRSGVGAEIHLPRIPASSWLHERALDPETAHWGHEFVLAGGDDYELCFTAPVANAERIRAAGRATNVAVTAIGRIRAGDGLVVRDAAGNAIDLSGIASFDHFA